MKSSFARFLPFILGYLPQTVQNDPRLFHIIIVVHLQLVAQHEMVEVVVSSEFEELVLAHLHGSDVGGGGLSHCESAIRPV